MVGRTRKLSRGVSMVELIIYIAILTLMTIVIVNGILQMASVFRRARTERKVTLAAETALERIVREIRLATGIVAISGSSLELKTFKDYTNFTSTNEVNKKIYCTSSPQCTQVKFDPDTATSEDELDLTSPGVTVEHLKFTTVTRVSGLAIAVSDAVRIEIRITAGSGQSQITHTYYGTAVLRGSY